MTPYENINTLDTYSIQAGNYIAIEIECLNADGTAIALTDLTYGCTLSEYGSPETTLETIIGGVKSETTNTMVIEITSEMTESLGDCLLLYRPFIISGEKVWRFQGKLYVAKTTTYTLPV